MDRWLNAKTVDFSDLPQVCPPRGVAAMVPARRLPDSDTPPNMPAWSIREFRRPDMPPDPQHHTGPSS